MSSNDQSLIAGVMESFVSEVPAKPFVSFCVFCNKGVTNEEMVYQKGKVFHKDCYEKHGSSFPQINQELLSESINAKVQLIQLKNLQIRMSGSSSSNKPKPKKKAKRKTKRVNKKKKTTTKRKKTKKKTKRKSSKKRRVVKRRTSPKRKKSKRKTKRRVSRKPKRKARRRR